MNILTKCKLIVKKNHGTVPLKYNSSQTFQPSTTLFLEQPSYTWSVNNGGKYLKLSLTLWTDIRNVDSLAASELHVLQFWARMKYPKMLKVVMTLTFRNSGCEVPQDTEVWLYLLRNLVAAQHFLILDYGRWNCLTPHLPKSNNWLKKYEVAL